MLTLVVIETGKSEIMGHMSIQNKKQINKCLTRQNKTHLSRSIRKPTTWLKFLICTFLPKNYFHALHDHYLKY